MNFFQSCGEAANTAPSVRALMNCQQRTEYDRLMMEIASLNTDILSYRDKLRHINGDFDRKVFISFFFADYIFSFNTSSLENQFKECSTFFLCIFSIHLPFVFFSAFFTNFFRDPSEDELCSIVRGVLNTELVSHIFSKLF